MTWLARIVGGDGYAEMAGSGQGHQTMTHLSDAVDGALDEPFQSPRVDHADRRPFLSASRFYLKETGRF